MTPAQFKTRFGLHQMGENIPSPILTQQSKAAAVLVPVIEKPAGLSLILTQRPEHLRHHPGQISFPGGKVEQGDISLVDTALREASEEIGLLRNNVDVLGSFPSHRTFTGFEVTPVIGLVKAPFQLALDPGEVADCFTVPLSFFTDKNNRHQVLFNRKGQAFNVHVMPYQDKFIWGVTAAIIDLLCRHITHD
ncbi:CoA pyrophosphatase [Shewanella maritima]|uniref:CoA pyrophosphatase n=1 Tax=Shewanella maritima TaxID=2520507 RepID=UPI003735DF52